MPIIAIGAAVGSLAMGGAATIGGLIAGTTALTLGTAMTAVATVGAVVGAVGAVTGNKDLSMAGMVLGGIGGIGSLAASAGLFGAEAASSSMFGDWSGAGADALAPVMSTPMNASMAAFDPLASVASTPINAAFAQDYSGMVDTLGNLTDVVSTPSPVNIANSPAIAGTQPAPSAPTKSLINDLKVPDLGSVGGDQKTTAGGFPANPKPGDTWAGENGKQFVHNGRNWEPDLGFFEKMTSTPMGQYGMLQAGGSLISGLFDETEPAQIEALKAQAEANRISTAAAQAQLKNMNSPIPVARRVAPVAVTGAPAPGMINTTVTGQVTA